MKGLSNLAAAACAVLLLCQCASQDEIRQLNQQLRTVNQKVKKFESATAEKMKEVDDQVTKGAANSSNKLDSVAEETRQLKSVNQENVERFNQYKAETEDKIASLKSAIEQMRSENDQLTKSNEELIRSLELRMEQLAGSLQRSSQDKIQDAARRAREAELRAKAASDQAAAARKMADQALVDADATAEQGTTLKPASRKVRKESEMPAASMPRQSDEPSSRQEDAFDGDDAAASSAAPAAGGLFAQAMDSFKSKDYKTAYKGFEQFLSGQPKDDQAAQALYLMGECLFNQGEYDLAILDYQKVISNYGEDRHRAAAMLRQAMSFEKLTDNETAKIIYAKLTAEYPDTKEANVARERLEKL